MKINHFFFFQLRGVLTVIWTWVFVTPTPSTAVGTWSVSFLTAPNSRSAHAPPELASATQTEDAPSWTRPVERGACVLPHRNVHGRICLAA